MVGRTAVRRVVSFVCIQELHVFVVDARINLAVGGWLVVEARPDPDGLWVRTQVLLLVVHSRVGSLDLLAEGGRNLL